MGILHKTKKKRSKSRKKAMLIRKEDLTVKVLAWGYSEPLQHRFVDGNCFIDHNGYYRLTKSKALLHRVLYEITHTLIPTDWCIHHINYQKLDNNPINLIALPWEVHDKVHKMGDELRSKLTRFQIDIFLNDYIKSGNNFEFLKDIKNYHRIRLSRKIDPCDRHKLYEMLPFLAPKLKGPTVILRKQC